MRPRFHLAVVLFAVTAHAADIDPAAEAKALKGAVLLAKALQERNAAEVTRLTLPDLVWAGGGEAKMTEILQAKFDEATRFGGIVESVTLGTPSELGNDGETLFVFIPYIQVARTPKVRLIDESFFLAISDDAGSTWHYVEGLHLDETQIKRALVRGYDGKPALPKANRRFEKIE